MLGSGAEEPDARRAMRVMRRRARGRLGALAAFALLAAASLASPAAGRDPVDAGTSGARDAGAGPPATGRVVVPDLEDVEHMCALLTSCENLPLPTNAVPKDFAACVRTMYAELASPSAVAFSLTLRECGLSSNSCGAFRTCALRGVRPDICAGRGKAGPVDTCDEAGRAVTCNAERVALVRDCPRGGEQCVVRDGKATCALGACAADAPASCSPSGTRILECKKGKLGSLDCGAFGLRCVSTVDGPQCATLGASCREGTVRCDGRDAIGCFHGREVRVGCGARGMSCADGASADGHREGASNVAGVCAVAAPGKAACDPASPARCDGGTIRYCAWGTPRSYLCKSMGLTRCAADDKGVTCQ